MNNAGTLNSADDFDPVAMVQNRIHHRAIHVSCAGVHNKARRFIDNHEEVVLKKNVERDVLRGNGRGGHFGGNV